jgi:hypothetical protein
MWSIESSIQLFEKVVPFYKSTQLLKCHSLASNLKIFGNHSSEAFAGRIPGG